MTTDFTPDPRNWNEHGIFVGGWDTHAPEQDMSYNTTGLNCTIFGGGQCPTCAAATTNDPEPFTCCTSRLPGVLHTFECEEAK